MLSAPSSVAHPPRSTTSSSCPFWIITRAPTLSPGIPGVEEVINRKEEEEEEEGGKKKKIYTQKISRRSATTKKEEEEDRLEFHSGSFGLPYTSMCIVS